jgi:uncharacterized membrane-anchored protein YitT (DUF2179 family)
LTQTGFLVKHGGTNLEAQVSLCSTFSNPSTPDFVLNTLYGGVVSGIGFGLVYRGRGGLTFSWENAL